MRRDDPSCGRAPPIWPDPRAPFLSAWGAVDPVPSRNARTPSPLHRSSPMRGGEGERPKRLGIPARHPGISRVLCAERLKTDGMQIGTGAAALMAIRVLTDHGILESHIIFLTFLISQRGGPNVIRRAFPRVRIVTSAIDDALKGTWAVVGDGEGDVSLRVPGEEGGEEGKGRRQWVISPGMGNIGDRYYL